MEGEKKRKRVDYNHQGQVRGVGESRSKEKDVAPAPVPMQPPSEEEVEEFYTILRRMNVAIKYFEKGGTGKGVKANGDWLKKRTTASEVAQVEGLKIGRERKMGVVIAENGTHPIGLDLNVVPETEI